MLRAHSRRRRSHTRLVPRAGRALPHHLRRQSRHRRCDRKKSTAHRRRGATLHGRAQTARRHHGTGESTGERGRARPCPARPEEGDRPGAAPRRSCRGDDRRRRERRARHQGGRPGHRDGQRGTRHQGRGAGGARRFEILASARCGGTWTPGHGQHGTRGQPVPRQNRIFRADLRSAWC